MRACTPKAAAVHVAATFAIMGAIPAAGMLSSFVFVGVCQHDKPHRALRDLRAIRDTLDAYGRKHHRFPTANEGFAEVVRSGELERMPVDPWLRPYVYSLDGNGSVIVKSHGRDGLPGGCGRDSDIVLHFDGEPEVVQAPCGFSDELAEVFGIDHPRSVVGSKNSDQISDLFFWTPAPASAPKWSKSREVLF